MDVDWRGQRASHADIAISGLTFDERELTQFNAVLDGTTTEHTFKLDALAAQDQPAPRAARALRQRRCGTRTIADLFIDDAANIKLELDAPVAVMASATAFRLDAPCACMARWRDCAAKAPGTTAGWNARADARNLPISTLTAGLTPRVEYQGTVNATANLSGSRGAPFVGEARADLVDAAIRHKLASGRTDVISFGSGFITLRAQARSHERASCGSTRPHAA